MALPLPPGQPYAGRRHDARVINSTIDADAAEILYRYAPRGMRGTGGFLSRLLYEHEARVQERQRLEQEQAVQHVG